MGYLILAVASSAAVSVVLRWSEKYVKNTMGMFVANYGVCLLLACVFMGGAPLFLEAEGRWLALFLGVVNGLLYLMNFVLLQKNMQYNGIVLPAAFMKLGVLVPTVMAVTVFGERLGLSQGLGIAAAVAAILLLHLEKGKEEKRGRSLWLVALLLLSGFTDSMANIYDKLGSPQLKNLYLFYTFLAALLIAALFCGLQKQRICGGDVIFGLILGIPNYFSARFLLLALGSVPAVITYPFYSVATILVVSVLGVFLFRERISRQKWGALGIILAALVLLNL